MKKISWLLGCCLLGLIAACSSDHDENQVWLAPVINGLENSYSLSMGESVTLSPEVEHAEGAVYSWTLDDEVVSQASVYEFHATKSGTFHLVFSVQTQGGRTVKSVNMVVLQPEALRLETQAYEVLAIDLPEAFQGADGVEWKVVSAASDLYRLQAAGGGKALFVAARAGKYHGQATSQGLICDVMITVKEPAKKLSPYIAKVYDYLPAPGQFVNQLPPYEPGDSHADMVRKAGEWLVGEEATMITLGGWGGYVVFGFDHLVLNVAGKRDFRVNGNAFGSADNGRPNAPFGGSCEPGIVMVAYDANGNGQPDEDEWYEIKGSSNFSAEKELWYDFAVENKNDVAVYRDYSMTYHRPQKEEPELDAEPGNPLAFATIEKYIRWTDNQNNEGYKVKNVYHNQSYYPAWVDKDELQFKGIRLPNNAINEGKFNPGINQGSVYYVLYGFRYGYVDNYPNLHDNSAIDIDWAIDKEGNAVHLPGIHFVKVYNAINQENGWLGECSTEVDRGEDLHMLGKRIDTVKE